MEEVAVEERLRARCKRFAIKDKGIGDRCEPGMDDRNESLTAFFPLRTTRVVTRVVTRVLDRRPKQRMLALSLITIVTARVGLNGCLMQI
jgi:hypothetical protein